MLQGGFIPEVNPRAPEVLGKLTEIPGNLIPVLLLQAP